MNRYRVSIILILTVLATSVQSVGTTGVPRLAQSTNKDLYAPEIVLVKPDKGGFTTKLDSVVFEGIVLSYKLPLIEVTLLQNEVPIFRKKPDPKTAFRFPFSVPVKLQPGKNMIRIMARNERRAENADVGPIVYNASTNLSKPNLIVLSLGISSYKDASLNLATADSDVDEFTEKVKAGSGCLFQSTKVKVIKGDEATRRGILSALIWMATETKSETDVRLVFIRGWTARDTSENFYLLTNDHTSDSELEFNDISYDLIWKRFKAAPGRVVFLLDGYFAGGFQSDPWVKRTLFPAGNVTAIVNSPSPRSIATGRSAFTFALLEGLGPKSDTSANRMIDTNELFAWLSRRVPELNKNRQQPVLWRDSSGLKPVEFFCSR